MTRRYTLNSSGYLFGIVLLLCMLLLAACTLQLVPTARLTEFQPSIRSARLTPEAMPYGVSMQDSRVTITSTASGTNNREIYWREDSPDTSSARQCAIWTSGVDIAQNGMAFRIASPRPGEYNAIVFARNIYVRWYWSFAPKLFHTGVEYGAVDWDSPPLIDLGTYLGRNQEQVFPLRVCASLSSDDVLRFAVAKGDDPMPPLTNPGIQGGSWKLDIAASYHENQGRSGKTGIFVGHIPNATALVFDDIAIDSTHLSKE